MSSNRGRFVKSAWALTLAGVFITLAIDAFSPLAHVWDVQDTEQCGQLSVYNVSVGGGFFGHPVEVGDFNGDGMQDVVMGPMAADGDNGTRNRSGEVYVYPGDQVLEGVLDRGDLQNPPGGLTLMGARAGDFLGTELFVADVNGDGIEDLLVGAQNYDGPAGDRDTCGGVFVVLGREDLLDAALTLDMAAPPNDVITIFGADAGDRLGIWVEAGDLDGDGYADLLLGADQTFSEDPSAFEYHKGLVVVIYGREEFPSVIDLAEVRANPESLPGTSRILGRETEDHFGASIHSRDLDHDGRDELIAAAALNRLSASQRGGGTFSAHASGGGDGPEGNRNGAGEVTIFFSLDEGERLPALVDLSSPLPPVLAGRVTTIHGASSGGAMGEEITSGDFNGDGEVDLALGALTGRRTTGSTGGTTHVLYGQAGGGLQGQTIDLSPLAVDGIPEGLEVSLLYGLNPLDLLGDTLSVEDFNNDGFDDLALGIPDHDLPGKTNAGIVAIAFGRPEFWPSSWAPQADVLPEDLQVAYVLGADAGDLLSYSMEARDFDGDGYGDVFPNAMRGDGSLNDAADAGGAYMVSGYKMIGASTNVDTIEPQEGEASQITPVVIAGQGFTTSADTRLFVDAVEVTDFQVMNATTIEANLPALGISALVDLRMENRYDTIVLSDAFRYIIPVPFIRSDSNRSGLVDLSDAITMLVYLFQGGTTTCLDAHDSNDDGAVDLADIPYILGFLFLGGSPPPVPFPETGTDPTADDLRCE